VTGADGANRPTAEVAHEALIRTWTPLHRRVDANRETLRSRAAILRAKTSNYAAIDIIVWLALTDPDVLALKPGTLIANILDRDDNHVDNCWKCLTIIGMTEIMHGYAREALVYFPAQNWGLRHCDQLILITQTPPDDRRGLLRVAAVGMS
jgi:hypothetical protein